MDILNTLSAARLLYDCVVKGKTEFSKIEYTPSKTALLSLDRDPFFKTASPKRVGVDGERLALFARTLSRDARGDAHSVVVLSHGKCVFEAAKAGYDTRCPQATFSMCKTLTALAIGLLIDDGRISLSDTAISFFPEHRGKWVQSKTKTITIRHLLTMSVDIPFNEAGVAVSDDYTKSYFESVPRSPHGKTFAYNSMNSYLLAAIVTRVTGKSLSAFLGERLFSPMKITNYFWETTANGTEKGGWGLYLSPRSMAKIGQLLLQKGNWEGHQLISEAWISQMIRQHISVSDKIGHYGYGYHIWNDKESDAFLLNGMLGQNVLVLPSRSLVVAITAGDHAMFQTARSLLAAEKHLTDMRPADSWQAKRERRRLARHFGEEGSYTPMKKSRESREAKALLLSHLLGQFTPSKNNSGVLPLLTRLIQNSPTKGITAVALSAGTRKNTLYLSITERDVTYKILLGEHRFLATDLSIRDEKYRVLGAYSFGRDADRSPFFKIELRFPALPNSRRLLFRKAGKNFTLTLAEQPGAEFAEEVIRSVPLLGDASPSAKESGSPLSWFMKRIKDAFCPTLALIREDEEETH